MHRVKLRPFILIISISLWMILGHSLVVSGQNLAMRGFCPVTILEQGEWKKGESGLKSTYDRRTYYFLDGEAKKKFDNNPPKYVPALGGDCIVCLVNMGKRVAGSVFHSVKHKDRLYLFPENRTKQVFKDSPEKFENADLGFEGHCPVCKKGGKNEKGKPEFTVIVNDIRYQMASSVIMEEFKRNPKLYLK